MSLNIIVDHTESRSGVPDHLRQLGLTIEIAELESGDYILCPDKGIAVERKSANDLVASLYDQRLFGQVARMMATYSRVVVMVEGDPFNVHSQILPEAIRGALSYLTIIEGVSVHQTASPRATAEMLATMTRHAVDGLGYEVPLRGQKPKAPGAMAQYLVEGLPNVGPSGAQRLLDHFGSPGAVFAATAESLVLVQGIGKKSAERIRAALDIVDLRRR
jgi:Fanconi anemia group M protein